MNETTTTKEVDYDEMGLEGLLALAHERGVSGYHIFTSWLEDHYDPAKAALIDLLSTVDGWIVDTETQA